MDLDKIKQLMDQFEDSDIRELQIDDQDFHLYLSKNKSNRQRVKAEKTASLTEEPAEKTVINDKPVQNLTPVKSPLVGVVYLQAKPGQEPFVEVGSSVTKGQTICIIEAMKMMTEVKSTVNGTVKEIKVENEDLVEVDQPLIMVEE